MIYSKEQARLNLISAVKLVAKAMKYDPDQPRDEAGRWSAEGGGGSDRGASGNEERRVLSRMDYEEKTNLVMDLAEKNGFSPSRLIIAETEGPEFTVGDKKFVESGHYNPETGEITVYLGGMFSSDEVDWIMAHECQHDTYYKWNDILKEEQVQYEKVFNDDYMTEKFELFGKDGYPKDSDWYQNTFPNLSLQDNLFKYAKTGIDGITNYSRAYWGSTSSNLWRNINETLSEAARLNAVFGDNDDTLSDNQKLWIAAYKEMKENVEKSKK